MLNRTYNNIIRLIGFTVVMGFVVLKMLDMISKSWWYMFIPMLLTWAFSRGREENIYIVRNTSDIEDMERGDSDDMDPEDDMGYRD